VLISTKARATRRNRHVQMMADVCRSEQEYEQTASFVQATAVFNAAKEQLHPVPVRMSL
jgi:hypothetical protein